MFGRKKSTRTVIQKEEAHYKQEIMAVGLSALFVFLALSFISYYQFDNTLFYYSSTNAGTANWCGGLGASVAALFFYVLGSVAYLFLLFLLFPIYLLLFKVSIKQELARLCMMVGTVMAVALLCASYQLFGNGGFVGMMGYQWLLVLAGPVGSRVALWSMLWIFACAMVRLPLFSLLVKGLRFCKTALYFVFKKFVFKKINFFRKREISPDDVLAFASKVPEREALDWISVPDIAPLTQQGDGFAHMVISDLPAGATAGIGALVPVRLTQEQQAVFAQRELRKNSQHIKIMKTPVAQIANTALTKNIFLVGPEGKSVYELLTEVIVSTPNKFFVLPDASFFKQASTPEKQHDDLSLATEKARKVEEKLHHFGVKGSIVSIKPGPVVTMFEYKPEIDSKISKIMALEDDLAMALTAQSLRIIAPIPGKNAVGFEIANQQRDDVLMSSLLASDAFAKTSAKLPIILGVDVTGSPIVADLATMPHLLVGGATGSGKSVGLNVMLLSLLCKVSPDDLKLILVDPKRLEFTPYADIPHLLFPIVTQPTRAAAILAWVVQEMEQRYAAMASLGVRSFAEYRKLAFSPEERSVSRGHLVVIIDELADLMMVAGKEVEVQIVRIAQMARAAGIHMIVATQRPSVDVVTGLIKVNFPSRVAFRVSSKVDSRTILDTQGAEKLLGRGDMLFMHASSPELKRVHGAYVSDQEVERVADFLREQRAVEYLNINEALMRNGAKQAELEDDLYPQVVEFVGQADEISISMLQRHYRIGFNRSARLIEKLEMDGLIAPAQGSKPRKVLR